MVVTELEFFTALDASIPEPPHHFLTKCKYPNIPPPHHLVFIVLFFPMIHPWNAELFWNVRLVERGH